MTGTILIADPVATNRITLKVRLAAACYSTAMAATAAEAAARALALSPDLIVADESLLAGGLCAMLAGAKATAAIPVIALGPAARRLAALRAGADAVIERPADEYMLLARIRSLLARGGDARGAAHFDREAGGCSGALSGGYPTSAEGAVTRGSSGFGMAEAAQGWTPGPVRPAAEAAAAQTQAQAPAEAPAPAPAPAPADAGRLVLVADGTVTVGWRQALSGRTPLQIEAATADRALADATSGRAGEVYLIAADLAQSGDGLRLLSELRARPASRQAAFIIALPGDRSGLAPIALDLGADEVLPLSMRDRAEAEAAALCIRAQLSRKRAADQRRSAAERERLWALTDPLTGLHNRRYALPRLEAMAARDMRGDLAVMIIDLDHFKAINDSLGHAAGDAVLTEVARRLQRLLPAGALIARIGGEEFLAAVPHLTPREAKATAEALRLSVAEAGVVLPDLLGGGSVEVTTSVGLAHGWPGEAAELLMLRADRALMGAKARGRNRVTAAEREAAA